LDVGCWFGDEHEGFVEAEEEAFVGFDGAFYPVHVVVTKPEEVVKRVYMNSRKFLDVTDLTKSLEGVMILFPDSPLKTREMT
jgi:hypothetical protein